MGIDGRTNVANAGTHWGCECVPNLIKSMSFFLETSTIFGLNEEKKRCLEVEQKYPFNLLSIHKVQYPSWIISLNGTTNFDDGSHVKGISTSLFVWRDLTETKKRRRSFFRGEASTSSISMSGSLTQLKLPFPSLFLLSLPLASPSFSLTRRRPQTCGVKARGLNPVSWRWAAAWQELGCWRGGRSRTWHWPGHLKEHGHPKKYQKIKKHKDHKGDPQTSDEWIFTAAMIWPRLSRVSNPAPRQFTSWPYQEWTCLDQASEHTDANFMNADPHSDRQTVKVTKTAQISL